MTSTRWNPASHPSTSARASTSEIAARKAEADAFYATAIPAPIPAEEALVARQAFAGLLWGKQFFHYDVKRWLAGDPGQPPPPPGRGDIRNGEWQHLDNHEVILMPDPWEYPWFAAWDLAFHCVTLAHIDPAFAKAQLILLLREWYMHPNGQIPAYEWNFSDVNPPVHAWAALRVFVLDGGTDFTFLARVFHKLLINFTWWVDNKDHGGKNLFQGGFMGLDNIAPLDRSTLPPELGYLEQADSTAWMAAYAQDLLDMALRLAQHNRSYEDVATKFFEHFLMIAGAANDAGLWDEQDSYFYDILHLADGTDIPIKVKSLVGLVPISAALSYSRFNIHDLPDFFTRAEWFLENHPEYRCFSTPGTSAGSATDCWRWCLPSGLSGCWTTSSRRRVCSRTTGSGRFRRGTASIRSASQVGGVTASVDYEPAESTTNLFGGNSNWRGPIWMPLNALLIEALRDYDELAPGEVTVEYPAGSGQRLTLAAAADDISRRLDLDLPARPERPTPGARLVRPAGHRPPLEGQHPVPRVLPRRHRDGPRCGTPDRVDGAGRPPDPHHPAPLTRTLIDRQVPPGRGPDDRETGPLQFHRSFCRSDTRCDIPKPKGSTDEIYSTGHRHRGSPAGCAADPDRGDGHRHRGVGARGLQNVCRDHPRFPDRGVRGGRVLPVAGRRWARVLAMIVAALAVIGNLSVVLYYNHTTTVAVNIVGLVLGLAILVLLLLPVSRAYYQRPG